MPEFNKPEQMQAPESGSEFDELIRSSIATYGEPEPNSELGQRILVRIAAEVRPAASRKWLPWAIAVPIAACLVGFFVLSQLRPVHPPAGISEQDHRPAQLHNDVVAAAPHQSHRENRKRLSRSGMQPHLAAAAVKAQPLPKLGVFPTPRSLSPAEQSLVAFAAHASMAERKAFIEAQQQPDTPLTIAGIKIQPIELPELGN